jgi:hypothetical protein
MKTLAYLGGTLVMACTALIGFPANGEAQDDKPDDKARSADAPAPVVPAWLTDVKLGATLEGYYQFNFNEPVDRVNALRAYDTRSNSFSLQQAAVVIDAAPDVSKDRRFGMRLDFQFGQATEALQGSAANEPRPEVYRNVWQAFGSYIFPVGRGLRVDFGKFASALGYETNYAKDNQAFSRAYLFNFLPYYHSGLRVTLPVTDKVSVMYTLTNGIQETEDFNNFKSQHASVTLTPTPKISATLNAYVGQEQPDHAEPDGPNGFFKVFDAYVSYALTPALTVAADVNRTTNQLTRGSETLALRGIGTYARYQIRKPFAAGLRYEHLDDDGLFGGVAQKLQEVTVTAEYKIADGFLMRGEYRRDWSDRDFFPGSRPDERKRAQNTLTAGLIWWVGNKDGAW